MKWFLFVFLSFLVMVLKAENYKSNERIKRLEILEERNRKCVIYLMGKTEDMEYDINKDIEEIIKSIENSDKYEI